TIQVEQIPPLPEGECGEGEQKPDSLTTILNQFSETFPTYEFLAIFLETLNDDEEVVKVLSLLMTSEFNSLINKIGDIDEWVEITDIFCDDLSFNVNFYLKVLGDLIKVIPIDPSTPKSKDQSEMGVKVLIQQILDILPLDEWQPKIDALVEYNENVQIAIDTIKGDLFKVVVNRTMEMDEFKLLTDNLRASQYPVDCIISHMQRKLDWPHITCAEESDKFMNMN
ncbi:hypothetical protein Bhyg_04071, partial [Pseudolycoriella hygida]